MQIRFNPAPSPIPVTGRFTIDIRIYDTDVDQFLRGCGAVEWDGPAYNHSKFKALHFPGSKPVHNAGALGARIFFNDEGQALLFSIAFGHYITHSNVKQIKKLLEENQ